MLVLSSRSLRLSYPRAPRTLRTTNPRTFGPADLLTFGLGPTGLIPPEGRKVSGGFVVETKL